MYRKISLILKCILISALIVSCSAKQPLQPEDMQVSFVNVHHSELHIPVNAIYQWSEGFVHQVSEGRLHYIDMWSLLKQGIEQEMQNKGYRKIAQTEQADIDISFVAALTSALDDHQIQQQYGLVPGLVTQRIDHHRYEKGTLIFDVVNPETQQLAWRTAGQALASLEDIPLVEREERIKLFVKKLLAFLPDAK
ncbi:MAG: DUF4136 domain-containing protein [Methyloprofundus sp.]|nr:DUF4136 domain-containing protein [Methyloprofundus sp.]